MSYSNASLVTDLLGRALTSAETTLLPYILSAVDKYIDSETGLTWGSSSATKYFDGGSTPNGYLSLISFPAATGITAISYVDGDNTVIDTFDDADYVLGPLNSTTKTYVEFRNRYLWTGLGNIAITASWGSGTVPDDIVYLATYMANKYLANQFADGTAAGKVSKESLEGYSREYAFSVIGLNDIADEVVASILGRYTADNVFL